MNGAALRAVLIATGALSALLAVLAIFDQMWELVYGWLGLALLTEAALLYGRAPPNDELSMASTNEHRVLGAIALLTSVFVPLVALLHAGFLDGIPGAILAGLVMLSAVHRLGSRDWAAPVTQFEGFPAAWGVAGFMLHAFDATPFAATLAIGTMVALSTLPVSWPHPLQSRILPAITRWVAAAWSAAAASTLWHGFPAAGSAKAVMLAAVFFGAALSAQTLRVNGFASVARLRKPTVFGAMDAPALDPNETTRDHDRK